MENSSNDEASAARTAADSITHNDDTNKNAEKKSPGFLTKLGLDVPTLIVMMKGSLPPAIAIAIYQSHTVASYFLTFGYFIAIASFFAMPALPRGKFIVHIFICCVMVCVAAAISLLAIWSAIRARWNTSPNSSISEYNSSQNAVLAIWLIANTWFINILRAKIPILYLPSIPYTIVYSVSCTFSQRYTTLSEAEHLVRELLVSMLSGFGISAAVSLLVIPITSRKVASSRQNRLIGLIQEAMGAQKAYLSSIDHTEKSQDQATTAHCKAIASKSFDTDSLKQNSDAILQFTGELRTETAFAQWDIDIGKLNGEDYERVFELLRAIVIPIAGMSTVMNLFQIMSDGRHWVDDADIDGVESQEIQHTIWISILRLLREAFDIVCKIVDDGLQHAGMVLEILPPPKATKAHDIESNGRKASIAIGEPGFAEDLNKIIQSFHDRRSKILRKWVSEHGPSANEKLDKPSNILQRLQTVAVKDLAQLYMLLFLEKMMHSTVEGVQELVSFADEKRTNGTMKQMRLILPHFRKSRLTVEDFNAGENLNGEVTSTIMFGDSYYKKRDPEHRPPINKWQKFGDTLHKIPQLLGSEEASFALRAACATMSIGIVAYLENTQHFYQEQRLVWGMIMVSVSMTTTSGQSTFGFFLRIAGTVAGMILCYITWYIVDDRTPGIIVFLWFFIFIMFYFLFKFPQIQSASGICVITMLLIIGYELQVRKIGKATATRTGQPYYPLYYLAPYRLATVAGGMLVAFIWTIFPSPIVTDRRLIRREISSAMYFLAKYFSLIQETMKMKLGHDLNVADDSSKTRLQKLLLSLRVTQFGKIAAVIPSIEQHLKFQHWEPTIGGSFPREVYEDIVVRLKRCRDCLLLKSYILDSLHRRDPTSVRKWSEVFEEVLPSITSAQHMTINALTLLSNSMLNGQSLPPYLPLPKPFELTAELMRITKEREGGGNGILDIDNVEQYGYAEFAVLEVCSTHLREDLEGLVQSVSSLVGVVDFSLHPSSGNDDL